MLTFKLPHAIADLLDARNRLRAHYKSVLQATGSQIDLKFTLDGNLVGDIGEAVAVELFGIRLVETRSYAGIDGCAPDGRSVQIKATGTGRGPAFRLTETRADHLLFFDLDFEGGCGTVVFNGPEHIATRFLPDIFTGQRSLTRMQICKADETVSDAARLPMIRDLKD
ncbi:hypothetical protein OVA03_13645 [Asticcacaulis sp. SL142]|uniref:DUF6998 domain-containing protein n=1 Tax=Asticcacaulis sp. SL142 TaxID=2995155 RepID=UPI00226C67B8|nr:hypothetical protein [Asticcacaulis sp. SL142]WAC47736.1 hypothetical protein OVA03_13645 [Asticcacaulis sp. SL142]